jgi:hypothetical protein
MPSTLGTREGYAIPHPERRYKKKRKHSQGETMTFHDDKAVLKKIPAHCGPVTRHMPAQRGYAKKMRKNSGGKWQ